MSSCLHCGVPISKSGKRGPSPKYCSDACRNRAKWERQKASNPCPGCSEPMARSSSSSAVDQRCRKCRFGGREHGTMKMYDYGRCRCDRCKSAKASSVRQYRAKRKASGRPIARTRSQSSRCEQCNVSFLTFSHGRARFCSLDCANDFQGRSDSPRTAFKISKSARLAIYEAANWVCALCESPTRPDEDPNHPRYPTLDHIHPRSLGGSDDLVNLRLACRQCNVLRGNNVDWAPLQVEVA